MQTIRIMLAITIILAIVAGAVYLGGWLLFIGGIVAIVEACKASPIDGLGIATGLLRVFVAGPAFWISIMLGGAVASIAWPSRRRSFRGF